MLSIFMTFFKRPVYEKIVNYLISFAVGTMLATSFFEIIPESIEEMGKKSINYILIGILLFLLVEKYIHWHHCNMDSCEKKHKKVKPYVFLNLIGDGLHNFIDGAIIAAAYMTDFRLGVITTFSVAVHELPQEIGDFSILLKGGMNFRQAIYFNFLIALTALMGGMLAIFLSSYIHDINPILLSVAAGGFIYLSLSDIVPETHKETRPKNIVNQTLILLLGILIIYLLILFFPE